MKRIIAFLMSVVLIMTLFAGCGNADKKDALVIVVGKHANSRAFDKDELKKLLSEPIEKALKSSEEDERLNIELVVADGNPGKATRELRKYVNWEDGINNSRDRKRIYDGFIDFTINYIVDDVKATDEEVDLYKAINISSRNLNQYDSKEYNRNLIIIDTGLSTTGKIDMRNFDFSKPAADYVEEIAEDIQEYSISSVVMAGLGNVGGEQESSEELTAFVTEYWETFFDTANIGFKTAEATPGDDAGSYIHIENDESEDNYPYVSKILMENDASIQINSAAVQEPSIKVVLRNSELAFKANSSEFRSREQAIATFNKLDKSIKDVINETNNKIIIVGSIAKTKEVPSAKSDECSKSRAEAVRDILVSSYGVPKDRIVIVDAGTTKFSWRNANEVVNGRYIEREQQKNRVVAIISSNHKDLVKELTDAGYNVK